MGNINIKFLNSENLPAFGEVLHRTLLKDFNNLHNVSSDYELSDTWTKVMSAIDTVYQKAGISSYSDGVTNKLRIGDIILLNNGHVYSVTGLSTDIIRTFPKTIIQDYNVVKPSLIGFNQASIKRPNLSNINSESYENIVLETLPKETTDKFQRSATASFKAATLSDDSTHIQIGDLIMGIDPIQLSFTTQNGYQYYPTIRTNGNPKLPTMQQIKNINIVLMFPNVDAINYQLIPLYAMFKRTPFVNIKNRDLLRFFHDVATPNGYIPVALESIQVQSIEGFPNSLQATITVLPFEPGPAANGVLKALRSFDDVFIQQGQQSRNIVMEKMINDADLKMQDISSVPTTFDSLTNVVSDGTENFRESFPFRAFYQSLIAGRTRVLNEDGSEAVLYNTDESSNLLANNIALLSPRYRKNFLYPYDVDANRNAVSFKYSYVTLLDEGKQITSLADIGKYISNERIDDRDARLKTFKKLFDAVRSWEDLAGAMFSSFHDMSDAFRPLEYQYSKMDNLVNDVLVRQGIDPTIMVVKGEEGTGPGIFTNLGKIISVLARCASQKLGIANVTGALQSINNISNQNQESNIASADEYALISKGRAIYNNANTGELSQYGVHTLDGAFQSLWRWISEDATGLNKEKFRLVVVDIIERLKGNLTNETIVANLSESTNEIEYTVRRLPILPVEILIDNENDVISSWSLVFSNKFVPINLLAYKYPFYQHIGSDDPTLSLSITSVSNDRRYDLKEELARMSDRLYDSIKLINYTSPNLYTVLDPRVELTYMPGHIFHCFGIEKVVINSSNSTNIQGQPDSWNTVINLTQANFSLEQYHNISKHSNITEIEAIIAQLIPRIRIKKTGEFSVLSFKSPNHKLTLDEVVYMSYLFSEPGKKYQEHINKMINRYGKLEGNPNITGQDLLNAMAPKIKLYSEIDPEQEDGPATTQLKILTGENEKFKKLLTSIISEYNDILNAKTNAFISIIDENTSLFDQIIKGVKNSTTAILTGGTATIGMDLLAVLLLGTGPLATLIAPIAMGLTAGATILYTVTNILAEAANNSMKQRISGLVTNIINMYSKEMMATLGQAVIKDPPIRKRLLSPEIVSLVVPADKQRMPLIDIEKHITDIQNQKQLNCYPDFDMPITWETNGRVYKASPDFYLYNISTPSTYVNTYIKDSTDRLMKAGKMGMQLALIEHKNLYTRLDNLSKELNTSQNNKGNLVLSGIYDEIGYTKMDDSFLNLVQMYRLVSYNEEDIPIKSRENAERNAYVITESKKIELLNEHARVNESLKTTDPKMFEYEQAMLKFILDLNIAPKISDTNLVKFNIVWTARLQTLLEILALGYQIQSYFASQTALKAQPNQTQTSNNVNQENKSFQLSGQILERMATLKDVVWTILDNWKVVTTDVLNGGDPSSGNVSQDTKSKLKNLKEIYNKGLYGEPISDSNDERSSSYVQLPSIRNLESEIYNKIGYFIRLNTVIDLANRGVLKPYVGMAPNISLDSLPELGYIEAFNVRSTESVFRALEIERQLAEPMQKNKNTTLRFFPTFKIFFIEEDSNRYTILDDYYAYNAVQSIEIAKSKDSASTVAVLRLNNLIGTITDKLSFHRERSDLAAAPNFIEEDEAFFGTLNIKPGTKVQIKLGYAASDGDLPTVFTGRILEMNVGPITEMICQSFGAQLNHKILKEKFSFFSSEKEYGDIASALLDAIPGLENLGRKEIITLGLISGFSGRDLSKIRKNLFDNYLMSNVLGRLTADLKGFDNPRDENIYLPFNLSLYPKWKPRFDWIVYNQSVWDAIQEICLYCNNTNAVIKQYNNDPISQRNEQRETVVIGNKSGYYKWTDALSLSSIDVDDITFRVNEFNSLITNSNIKSELFKRMSSPAYYIKIDFVYNVTHYDFWGAADEGTLKSEFYPIWTWLSDPINANIIKKRLLSELDISIKNMNQLTGEAFKRQFKIFSDPIGLMIDNIDVFANSSSVSDPILRNVFNSQKGKVFPDIMAFFSSIEGTTNNDSFWKLNPDEYYSVRGAIDNTNPALCSDSRYKKIQQHHLVSESINLISNEIALNANFANKINLYYFDDPVFVNSLDGVQPDKFNRINMWPIKAFGDIKDEHIRELNIFQKNIDPYWFDVKEGIEGFYKGYRRLLTRALNQKDEHNYKKYIENVSDGRFGTFNINIPDWRAFPSFQIVGVNLLKKEVAKMYRGSIQIVGDPEIEPSDIIHIQDYINDMHGAVEVDEIVHTFTPDRGLITTITPALITYDRDPIQLEDVAVINKIYDRANAANIAAGWKLSAGAGVTIFGVGSTISNPIAGPLMAAAGVTAVTSGITHIFGNRYHRFLYDNLGNILGRDVINFTALLYHGLPFMCGFDGVDYTNLKTLITHKANNVNGLMTRLTVFSDDLAAAINTNFTPENFTFSDAILNKVGYLKWAGLKDANQLQDAFSFTDRLQFWHNIVWPFGD